MRALGYLGRVRVDHALRCDTVSRNGTEIKGRVNLRLLADVRVMKAEHLRNELPLIEEAPCRSA